MKARLLPLSLLLSLSCSLPEAGYAQEVSELLQLSATTKGRALGGSTPALVANDIALGFTSPALFGQEQHGQLSLAYTQLRGGQHSGSAFYGRSVGERGAWGAGLRFLSYGSLQGFDQQGRFTGSFSASEALLQGSYSYELTDRLRAGITFKGLYSQIESYSSWGVGADLALSYYDEERDRSLGLALVHVGRLIQDHHRGSTSMPWDIQLGLTQRLAHAPFSLHLAVYDLHPKRSGELPRPQSTLGKVVRHLSLGIEFLPSERFWLALGYTPKIAQDVQLLSGYRWAGFSTGIGFEAPHYRISLALSAQEQSIWIPQLSLSTDFGRAW